MSDHNGELVHQYFEEQNNNIGAKAADCGILEYKYSNLPDRNHRNACIDLRLIEAICLGYYSNSA